MIIFAREIHTSHYIMRS